MFLAPRPDLWPTAAASGVGRTVVWDGVGVGGNVVSPVFIGRREEPTSLAELLEQAKAKEPAFALIGGEAGSARRGLPGSWPRGAVVMAYCTVVWRTRPAAVSATTRSAVVLSPVPAATGPAGTAPLIGAPTVATPAYYPPAGPVPGFAAVRTTTPRPAFVPDGSAR